MTQERALPQVKSALQALISNRDHRVFALTGAWGTGKTFLWKEIERDLWPKGSDDLTPVYTSLFGVQSIKDLRLRLLKQVSAGDKSKVQKVLDNVSRVTAGLAQRFGGIAIEDIVLTWLPDALRGRLVVIDDVERKSSTLGIDEFLGFVDEFRVSYDVRVLLLLNEDRLGDSTALWSKLREKVIDAEVVLNTAPQEAFEIALGARDPNVGHVRAARAALYTLSVTNIRIIKRVLNVVDRIYEGCGLANDVAFERWVPSTALMAAAHFHALEDPPTFEYLRNESSWERFFSDERDGQNPQHQRWNELLSALQIRSADDFENILESFLRTGLLDENRLRSLFQKYRETQDDTGADERRSKFLRDFYWGADQTDKALVETAKALLPYASAMAPPHISEVVDAIYELGDSQLASRFLEAWLSAAESRPEYRNLRSRNPSVARKLRSEVELKLHELYDRQNPPLSLREAVVHLVTTNNWSDRHIIPLVKSTAAEYESLIQSLTGDLLAEVVLTHLNWAERRAGDPSFAKAANNFVIAARSICESVPQSRIASILRRSFELKGLGSRLEPEPKGAAD